VILRRGVILIETAHDDPRPFVVQTGEGWLRPLGTRFTVRRNDTGTELTVLAKVVAATPEHGHEQRVTAGERLWLRVDAQPQVAPSGADAWTHGMLAVDNARLGEVVAELARYRRGYLAADPRVAELRVTGSFPLHDLDLALAALAQTLPVQAQRRTDGWITLVPRE
jgi:transmembrane sensor